MKYDHAPSLPAYEGPDGLVRILSATDSQGDEWEPTLTDLVALLKALPRHNLKRVLAEFDP